MEVIKIHHPHSFNKDDFPPLSLALGYFDGVHLGHQRVINQAQTVANHKGLKSAVMTFDPHPSVILGRSTQHVEYITPLEEKLNVIEKLNIDYVFVVHFTHAFANLLPQEFIDQYVISLNAKHVVAGFDYTYGKMGKGTMETLPFHSREEFDFTVVPKLTNDDEKISSSLIRSLIREGKTDRLQGLLGRYYTTTGIVIHGDKRGRTIGFPTANIDVNSEYIIPPLGVYSVRIQVANLWYEGVCNIGYKPTFHTELKKPSIEVHIFDFNEEIYGQEVKIEWHSHIRSEQKFTSIDELVTQIARDKQKALSYFEKNSV
ncbi:bifunctional riboflavin kinase/FAD synthetase [Cytobacillus spongiae]|jgi:riboflavin kinase/FMN adenylyltransferase|uniref:bifunctional riboflavin kinase/FAD synthetase n=1 Tax=Cytobacillus spongiae TaxID=2901381 RepID=UPI001F4694DE|nr:bifunctional riboflavin kinase/FAD synthetase [Cytobacillus spongiae]UII57456.1 bifunctional riboflavin kinase/FAD synthetase [Cytobacillus spongiae]